MQVFRFHSWDVTPREAIQLQARLRAKVIPRGGVRRLRLVAGADVAFDKHSDRAYAAVVVLKFPTLETIEEAVVQDRITFPYIPGLLSFREAPSLLRAFLKLKQAPDLIFIDGHGLSHPRSAGIACHIGVLLDRPVIGCAKSVLVGTYEDPGPSRGSVSYLYDGEGRVIGAAVRTRDRVRPVFVSIGHRIGLSQAIRFTLSCGKGYRIPEPLRQAHLLAEGAKREGKAR
jgi:deoxyribonuclease V